MKKILSILSIVAAAVMVTVCVSCKKNEPSSSEDRIALAVAALGTDGKELTDYLTKNGFKKVSEGEYKSTTEICSIKGYKSIYEVSFYSDYDSFSDAKEFFKSYHEKMISKARDKYNSSCTNGYGTKTFSKPEEFIGFVNALTEKDCKSPNSCCTEDAQNSKSKYEISNNFIKGKEVSESTNGYTVFFVVYGWNN